MSVPEYEQHHRRALARELTAEAGFPLRDRYGFAASDESVDIVLAAVFGEPDDAKAGEIIGLANATEEAEVACSYDMPATEEYEAGIVAALRPLVEQRVAAGARSMEGR
jgi:hypothetical protein